MKNGFKISTLYYRNSLSMTLLWILSLVSMVICLGLNFWALDRSYISSDEGWYMYLFDHQIVEANSHGHILFGAFPCLSNLYLNRLVVYVLKVIATAVFCVGIHMWFKKKLGLHSSLVLILGLVSLSQMYISGCTSINYTQLLHIIALESLGVLFLALTYRRCWLFMLSGAILFFLFPVKATSIVFIPIAIVAVWRLSGVKHMLYFVAGGLLALFYFVFVIESPSQIVRWIQSTLQQRESSVNYQYQNDALIKWAFGAIKIYFKWIFMAFVLISLRRCVWQYCVALKGWVRSMVFVALSIILLYYMWVFMYPTPTSIELQQLLRTMLWVLTITACAYAYRLGFDRSLLVISALLMLAPACISFGTNVPFLYHHITVYFTVMLMVAFVLPGAYALWFRWVVICLFAIALYVFATEPLTNWHCDRYANETESLAKIGLDQDIKVNPKYIERVEYYRSHIPAGADVIVSIDNWAIVNLLGYNALRHDYRQHSLPLITSAIDSRDSKQSPVYLIITADEYYSAHVHGTGWREIIDELTRLYDVEFVMDDIAGYAIIR